MNAINAHYLDPVSNQFECGSIFGAVQGEQDYLSIIVTRVWRDGGSKVNYYVHASGLHPQSNENVLERGWKHRSVNGGAARYPGGSGPAHLRARVLVLV